MVELDGGVGVHSLLQAQHGAVHAVDLRDGEVCPGEGLVPEVLAQLLPVGGHLLAVTAPRGEELHEGVAFPEE